MRVRSTGFRLAGLVAGLAGLASAALAGSATAATSVASPTAAWRVVTSEHGAFLDAVAAPSPTDVWALGTAGNLHVARPFGLHWDGTSWTRLTTANFPRAISKTGIGCAATIDKRGTGDRLCLPRSADRKISGVRSGYSL